MERIEWHSEATNKVNAKINFRSRYLYVIDFSELVILCILLNLPVYLYNPIQITICTPHLVLNKIGKKKEAFSGLFALSYKMTQWVTWRVPFSKFLKYPNQLPRHFIIMFIKGSLILRNKTRKQQLKKSITAWLSSRKK